MPHFAQRKGFEMAQFAGDPLYRAGKGEMGEDRRQYRIEKSKQDHDGQEPAGVAIDLSREDRARYGGQKPPAVEIERRGSGIERSIRRGDGAVGRDRAL